MSIALDAMLAATPDVCSGRICINGTRITVHRIATLYKQGQSAEDIARTYDLGVNSFIIKPSTFQELVEILKTLSAYWFNTVKLPAEKD